MVTLTEWQEEYLHDICRYVEVKDENYTLTFYSPPFRSFLCKRGQYAAKVYEPGEDAYGVFFRCYIFIVNQDGTYPMGWSYSSQVKEEAFGWAAEQLHKLTGDL